MNGPNKIQVWDVNGMYADISTYDVMQSNGVIHVIDRVLLPKLQERWAGGPMVWWGAVFDPA